MALTNVKLMFSVSVKDARARQGENILPGNRLTPRDPGFLANQN